MAILAGLIGIIVTIQPGSAVIRWAALFPLAAGLTGALRDILTCRLSAQETTVALLFYSALGVAEAGLATVSFVWTPVFLVNWGVVCPEWNIGRLRTFPHDRNIPLW